jgi:selenide,water dikinase
MDDAGVFAIGRDQALVQTVDFFTPVVDDPYDFGRIAAANSVSDVYAMGGTPLTALGILCFPDELLPTAVMAEILRGGRDQMRTAGVSIIGGHSVRDAELKFGYSVTGIVRPGRILTNAGVRPGDRLLLTKPLGTGILATALKRDRLDPAGVRRMTRVMSGLNRIASEAAVEFRARAATDVTGFGLLGHASQMADASGVTLRLKPGPRWFMPRALELASQGFKPAGLSRNREFYSGRVASGGLDDTLLDGLYDPQTSGGLLIAIPARRAEALRSALARRRAWVVEAGDAIARGKNAVELSNADE